MQEKRQNPSEPQAEPVRVDRNGLGELMNEWSGSV